MRYIPFWLVAVGRDGCGHDHRSLDTARACARRVSRRLGVGGIYIYRVSSRKPWRARIVGRV